VTESKVDHDVRGPGETAHEPQGRQDARAGESDEDERRHRVMHDVEEGHGAGRHLPAGVGLADPEEGRKVRHDPKDEEHPKS
jgi:hypothetical protein